MRIPRGPDALFCPVRAMEEWLRRTRIEYGAVFRRVSAGGALEGRLSAQGVWRVLRKRAPSFDQIAQATGEPLSTVASRYRRALDQLKDRLKSVV